MSYIANIDQASLDAATNIMKIVNGSWMPGGATQIKAKIQCEIIDLMQRFMRIEGLTMPKATDKTESAERLHAFLNAAAGEGFVLGGVDAGDLYAEIFHLKYAAALASSESPAVEAQPASGAVDEQASMTLYALEKARIALKFYADGDHIQNDKMGIATHPYVEPGHRAKDALEVLNALSASTQANADQADSRDAERFQWAIQSEDNAETLCAAVWNNGGGADAIRAEVDAARAQESSAWEIERDGEKELVNDKSSLELALISGWRVVREYVSKQSQTAQPASGAVDDMGLLPLPAPLEIDWPQLNSNALGCGVEDRSILNRYEAAEYGWQEGLFRAAQSVPEEVYTADQMRAYAIATQANADQADIGDAELLDWLERNVFSKSWNSVTGDGARYDWFIRGDYRHTMQLMNGRSATLREAIRSAVAHKNKDSHET